MSRLVYVVDYLDKALRAWEDYWYLVNLGLTHRNALGLAPLCSRERAALNFARFRRFLLHLNQQTSVDYEPFLSPSDSPVEAVGDIMLNVTPVIIGEWCRSSRRVYGLSAELQAILEVTSLAGIRWSDVAFPFPSFALRLERPILQSGNDFILFNRIDAKFFGIEDLDTLYCFRMISRDVAEYEPISAANRQNIENRIKKKQWDHVKRLIFAGLRKICELRSAWFAFPASDVNVEVMKTPEYVLLGHKNTEQDDQVAWEQIIRLVVGLPLYLKGLPSDSPHVSEWKPTQLPQTRSVVECMRETEICSVGSHFTLTREDRLVLGLETPTDDEAVLLRELRCHFREGHWRRPQGLGNDPTAEKTVQVRFTIVRRDKLKDGDLPEGSEKHLK